MLYSNAVFSNIMGFMFLNVEPTVEHNLTCSGN